MLVALVKAVVPNPSRCHEFGVHYLDSKVDKIIEANDGCSVVVCEGGLNIPCRLVGYCEF